MSWQSSRNSWTSDPLLVKLEEAERRAAEQLNLMENLNDAEALLADTENRLRDTERHLDETEQRLDETKRALKDSSGAQAGK